MSTSTPEHHAFATPEERDAWISEHHPERECSDVPGFYELPDGGGLGVYMLNVSVYPAYLRQRKARES